jgi:hypothetical protein
MRKILIHSFIGLIAFTNLGITNSYKDNNTYSGGTLDTITVTTKDPNNYRNSFGIFPKETFQNVRVDSAIQWNDTILLAALINTESQTATMFEKMLIAQTVVDRANINFNNYGTSIERQIFAPAQFSGVVQRDNGFRWCYYFHHPKGRHNNPKIANRFNYNPSNQKPIVIKRNGINIRTTYQQIAFENYEAARQVLLGNRPIPKTVLYFCNPAVSTDNAQVARVMQKAIQLPEKTKHVFAG